MVGCMISFMAFNTIFKINKSCYKRTVKKCNQLDYLKVAGMKWNNTHPTFRQKLKIYIKQGSSIESFACMLVKTKTLKTMVRLMEDEINMKFI